MKTWWSLEGMTRALFLTLTFDAYNYIRNRNRLITYPLCNPSPV